MSSFTQAGNPSPPAPPYPLRHVENRWHTVTIPAMAHHRGQVLPFALTPINPPKWLALFGLNFPARFTT